MKERLVTLGMAVAALALFWMLMFPKPVSISTTPRPLTTGAGSEGYVALYRWLTVAGVPTVDLHRRFDHLADQEISPVRTGNLLVITLPFDTVLHPAEYQALDDWVGSGNTLLVLAALDDTPSWSGIGGSLLPELEKVSGLSFNSRQEPDQSTSTRVRAQVRAALTPGGGEVELHPSGRLDLLQGVARLATHSALPSTQWQAAATTPAPVLELARRNDNNDPVLWLKASGKGVVVVSAYASVFTNGVIGERDNARLLSNLVSWALKPGGRVIVDDAHQGAMDEFDAAKFYSDRRLHITLWWLVALWLAWVLAGQPLRAAAPMIGGQDENVMLRATARFFAGTLRPVTAAQWMLDEFFERLRRRHGLLHGAGPPWEWMSTHAGIRSDLLDELRTLHSRTQAGQRVSLVRLQRIISQISGQTT